MSTLEVLLSGGFITALAAAILAFYKVKPERNVLVVKAAEGVVLMQLGLIEKLQADIQRLGEEMKEKEEECLQKIADLRDESEGKIKALQLRNTRMDALADALADDLHYRGEEKRESIRRAKEKLENDTP